MSGQKPQKARTMNSEQTNAAPEEGACPAPCYLVVSVFDDGDRCWNCISECATPEEAISKSNSLKRDRDCVDATAYCAVEIIEQVINRTPHIYLKSTGSVSDAEVHLEKWIKTIDDLTPREQMAAETGFREAIITPPLRWV